MPAPPTYGACAITRGIVLPAISIRDSSLWPSATILVMAQASVTSNFKVWLLCVSHVIGAPKGGVPQRLLNASPQPW